MNDQVIAEHQLEALRYAVQKGCCWIISEEGKIIDENVVFVAERLLGAIKKGADYQMRYEAWWLTIDGMLVRKLTDEEAAAVIWGPVVQP